MISPIAMSSTGVRVPTTSGRKRPKKAKPRHLTPTIASQLDLEKSSSDDAPEGEEDLEEDDHPENNMEFVGKRQVSDPATNSPTDGYFPLGAKVKAIKQIPKAERSKVNAFLGNGTLKGEYGDMDDIDAYVLGNVFDIANIPETGWK